MRLIFTALLLVNTAFAQLYILRGQSDAFGSCPQDSGLQSDLRSPIIGSEIFTQSGIWRTLDTTNNSGVTVGTLYPKYFGIELRLMKLLVAKYGPGQRIHKYSLGGSGLDPTAVYDQVNNWNPINGSLFSGSHTSYTSALNTADSVRGPPSVYIWIHGHADAHYAAQANNYQSNLVNFIAAERAFYHSPDLPFIVVQLNNLLSPSVYPFLSTVQAAQAYAAANIPNCYVIPTNGLPLVDGVHLNAAGYDEVAHRIFDKIVTVISSSVVKLKTGKIIVQ